MSYKIEKLFDAPQLFLIDEFLTPRECAVLISLAKKKGLKPSTAASGKKGEYAVNKKRQSSSIKIGNEAKIALTIAERIEKLTKIPKENGEDFQLSYYQVGDFFHSHYDTVLYMKNHRAYRRLASILIYLNDVEEGGETTFPLKGISILPKKGRAVLWYNYKNISSPPLKRFELPKSLRFEPLSLHSSSSIRKGEKWIITKWLHDIPLAGSDKNAY